MLSLKINEDKEIEMSFRDFFTGDFKHSEAFDLNESLKIANDILELILEAKKENQNG